MGNCPMPCPQFDEPDLPVSSSQEMHILSPPPASNAVQSSDLVEKGLPVEGPPGGDNAPPEATPVTETYPDVKKTEEGDTESVDSWDDSTTVEVSHDEARLQGDILQPDE